jgi:transposase-like protein
MDKLIKQVFVNRRSKGLRKSTEPYDLKLKARIIREYLKGDSSFRMLSRKYKINPGVLSRWVRVIKKGRPVLKPAKITKFTGMSKEKTIEQLREENKRLQRELEDERIRAGLYKKMIEIAERDLGIPIEKKYGARRSMNTGKQNKEQQG